MASQVMAGRATRQSALRAVLGALLLGCAPATPAPSPASTPAVRVLTGLEVLARDSMGPLRGLRLGLITNHTGVIEQGGRLVSGIDLLAHSPQVKLLKLFGPEHSISGRATAGERVGDARDEGTGLPVYSLYGANLKPTPEMLAGLDALVFDIQDVGTRYYTYAWTMALALRAAAENHIRFVVLDRPDPLGGVRLQGNVLDTAFATFVGLYPVPMRYGMTAGELARYINGEFNIGAQLTVVPVENWRRGTWYDQTGLPWVAPSPNMPSLESAAHYSGTCLFEGTNLSVGRGTDQAFQQIGAPWLQSDVLLQRVRALNLPGVRIDTVRFTPRQPGDQKFADQEVRGLRFTVTDRDTYDAPLTSLATLVAIRALQGDSLRFSVSHFDRLAGTDRVRLALLAGESVQQITAGWHEQRVRFDAIRRKYLLYH